jgi:hypothetical protein
MIRIAGASKKRREKELRLVLETLLVMADACDEVVIESDVPSETMDAVDLAFDPRLGCDRNCRLKELRGVAAISWYKAVMLVRLRYVIANKAVFIPGETPDERRPPQVDSLKSQTLIPLSV